MATVVEYIRHPGLLIDRHRTRTAAKRQGKLGNATGVSFAGRKQMVREALYRGSSLRQLEDHFDWLDSRN